MYAVLPDSATAPLSQQDSK